MAFEQHQKAFFPHWPQFSEAEAEALKAVIDSGKWWAGAPLVHKGENVWQFQEDFARLQGAKHCVACTNGTHAIEIALMAMDIGLGDEVIVSDYTFVASASAVVGVNAVPILCDVTSDNMNLDHQLFESLLTERTKAIVAVHLGGVPAKMDAIMEFAQEHNLKVIEDCAHAHGASYKGKKVGTWGDCGTFSFQASKTLTAGEGGAIVCNDDELADAIYSVNDCGRTKGKYFYHHARYGSNYRLSEFNAAVLNVQLKLFPAQHQRRNANAAWLKAELEKIEGVRCQALYPGTDECGYYVFCVTYDPSAFGGITKQEMYRRLLAANIPLDDCYPPLHGLECFREMRGKKGVDYTQANWGGAKSDDARFPVVCQLYQNSFWLPHENLLATQVELKHIVDTVWAIHNG
jgi:dTDP-4-amino-4,6-dideoxygalactose transaminase